MYQTFSKYIFKGSAGCLCTSFGVVQTSSNRTFSNHIIAEITRCVELFNMSLGCAESSLTASLQGKQGVQGAYALVQESSNLLKPHYYRGNKGCRVLIHSTF